MAQLVDIWVGPPQNIKQLINELTNGYTDVLSITEVENGQVLVIFKQGAGPATLPSQAALGV